METLANAARTWMMARDIIAGCLSKICTQEDGHAEAINKHNAEAIIARLANNKPPLLICTQDEMKEE